MTLREIIAAYEAHQPAPITLTPLAEARVAARRLARAVVALDDPKDRLDVMVYVTAQAVRLLTTEAAS